MINKQDYEDLLKSAEGMKKNHEIGVLQAEVLIELCNKKLAEYKAEEDKQVAETEKELENAPAAA